MMKNFAGTQVYHVLINNKTHEFVSEIDAKRFAKDNGQTIDAVEKALKYAYQESLNVLGKKKKS